jgi:hypothetical protein
LRANAGLSSPGFKLHGAGFIVSSAEAERLLRVDPALRDVLRPYRNGKDLTAQPRAASVIDFGLRDEAEARAYPVAFDMVRDRVKPERDANADRGTREKWWRFGRNREEIRPALAGLPRYVATPETSKHRVFVFLAAAVAPDNSVVVVAADDAFVLGVLSSACTGRGRSPPAAAWACATRRGTTRRVLRTRSPSPTLGRRCARPLGAVAERIEAHRARALAADPGVTLLKLYDVVEALRAGRALTAAQQAVHVVAACGRAPGPARRARRPSSRGVRVGVAEEPGVVLERLVQLHDARRERSAEAPCAGSGRRTRRPAGGGGIPPRGRTGTHPRHRWVGGASPLARRPSSIRSPRSRPSPTPARERRGGSGVFAGASATSSRATSRRSPLWANSGPATTGGTPLQFSR